MGLVEIEFESGKKRRTDVVSVTHTRNLKVIVNGSITQPLRRDELTAIAAEHLPLSVAFVLRGRGETWRFTEEKLSELETALRRRARDDEIREEIPVCNRVKKGVFPYEAFTANGG